MPCLVTGLGSLSAAASSASADSCGDCEFDQTNVHQAGMDSMVYIANVRQDVNMLLMTPS